MFTGIIKEVGTVKEVIETDGGRRIIVECHLARRVEVDQSININGVCHTAIAADKHSFTVQSIEETLRKSNIGELKEGDSVNLEPSLHPGQLLDGHLVQGHVDSTGTIKTIQKEESDTLFTIAFPEEFNNLIVGRGSVTVDGISLTVAKAKQSECTVAVIPYTYEHTNMQFQKTGDTVNLEFDILGKYVAKHLENRGK